MPTRAKRSRFRLVETLQKGDPSIFIGEVTDAGVNGDVAGRADADTGVLGDLGEKTFYGGWGQREHPLCFNKTSAGSIEVRVLPVSRSAKLGSQRDPTSQAAPRCLERF